MSGGSSGRVHRNCACSPPTSPMWRAAGDPSNASRPPWPRRPRTRGGASTARTSSTSSDPRHVAWPGLPSTPGSEDRTPASFIEVPCTAACGARRRVSDDPSANRWQSMGPVITRKVQLGDVELAIAEAGTGGLPLLLLHGFTGAKEDFTDWIDALAALGWHAVAPDHRGHGDSSKPAGVEAYSMSILATDSTALVDALGWGRYTLLGHSMGGFVAQRMAFADPARILGLILMDTGHGPVDGIDPDQVTLAAAIAVESGMDALADLMAEIDSPLDTAAHRRLVEDRPGYAQFEDRKLRAASPYLYASVARELTSCSDSLASLSGMDPRPPT